MPTANLPLLLLLLLLSGAAATAMATATLAQESGTAGKESGVSTAPTQPEAGLLSVVFPANSPASVRLCVCVCVCSQTEQTSGLDSVVFWGVPD